MCTPNIPLQNSCCPPIIFNISCSHGVEPYFQKKTQSKAKIMSSGGSHPSVTSTHSQHSLSKRGKEDLSSSSHSRNIQTQSTATCIVPKPPQISQKSGDIVYHTVPSKEIYDKFSIDSKNAKMIKQISEDKPPKEFIKNIHYRSPLESRYEISREDAYRYNDRRYSAPPIGINTLTVEPMHSEKRSESFPGRFTANYFPEASNYPKNHELGDVHEQTIFKTPPARVVNGANNPTHHNHINKVEQTIHKSPTKGVDNELESVINRPLMNPHQRPQINQPPQMTSSPYSSPGLPNFESTHTTRYIMVFDDPKKEEPEEPSLEFFSLLEGSVSKSLPSKPSPSNTSPSKSSPPKSSPSKSSPSKSSQDNFNKINDKGTIDALKNFQNSRRKEIEQLLGYSYNIT